MKTILAILFASELLVRAQQPPATNSAAAPVFPPLPPASSLTIPTNLDEAMRKRLIEALQQRAAQQSNASAASATAPTRSALPGSPGVSAVQPAAVPGNVLVPPGGGAARGAAPAPGALAPADGGAAPIPVVQATSPADEVAEYEFSYPNGMDLETLLDDYAALVNRTIIRPTALPGGKMILATRSKLTRSEAIQAFEIIFTMNGISTIPWGEKFMKVVPSQQVKIEAKDFATLDSTNVPPTGQYIAQIVHLKYARPSEVAPVILPYSRLQDIQAIDSSGILVIRDVAENIKRMMEMIDLLDVTSAIGTVEPEIIPIKYALAEDIASVLTSLTGGGGGTTVGRAAGAGAGVGGGRSGARRGGISASSTGGAYGPGGIQGGIQGGIPGARAGAAAPAAGASFAQRLNDIVNRVGGEFQVLGEVKIIADARTNSLLIFAGRDDMQMIKKIVDKLDVVLAQVLIEAIVLEVSLNDSQDLGVSAVQRPKSFTDKITGAGAMLNGNGQFLNNLTNFPGAAPKGFSYFANIGDTWNVALQAISTDGSVNVLSRPRIQTSHAKQASLFVGDTVPYVTGTYFGGYTGSGQASSQYTQRDIGIQIDVMPLINPDGLVIMDIQQVNIEQLGPATQIDGNAVPTTTKRYATANVAVRDGETIILGGFISNTRSKSKSGVPILKDIPILGSLFSSKNDSNKRVELIVLMRPTVLKTPEIATKVALDESAKLPGVRAAVKDYERDYERKMRQTGEMPNLFQGADTNATQQLWPHAIPAASEFGPAH